MNITGLVVKICYRTMADMVGCHGDPFKVLLLEEELKTYQQPEYIDTLPWQLAVIDELLASYNPSNDAINYYSLTIKRASLLHHMAGAGDHAPITTLKKTIKKMKDDIGCCDDDVKMCLYDLVALAYLKMAVCHHKDLARLVGESA